MKKWRPYKPEQYDSTTQDVQIRGCSILLKDRSHHHHFLSECEAIRRLTPGPSTKCHSSASSSSLFYYPLRIIRTDILPFRVVRNRKAMLVYVPVSCVGMLMQASKNDQYPPLQNLLTNASSKQGTTKLTGGR